MSRSRPLQLTVSYIGKYSAYSVEIYSIMIMIIVRGGPNKWVQVERRFPVERDSGGEVLEGPRGVGQTRWAVIC